MLSSSIGDAKRREETRRWAGVRVVTDSTADLGSLAAKEGVAVVPLGVSFGDETFEDGVTIDPQAFFARLAHRTCAR